MRPRTKHGLTDTARGFMRDCGQVLESYRAEIQAQLERDCKSPDSLEDVLAALKTLANAELVEEKPE